MTEATQGNGTRKAILGANQGVIPPAAVPLLSLHATSARPQQASDTASHRSLLAAIPPAMS
jgi:hypothetical protein